MEALTRPERPTPKNTVRRSESKDGVERAFRVPVPGSKELVVPITGVRSELPGLRNAKSSRGDVWGVGALIVATTLGAAAIGLGSFGAGVQLPVRDTGNP